MLSRERWLAAPDAGILLKGGAGVVGPGKVMETLRIVGIGGGTGLPVLLRGLGRVAGLDVSAIVSVADNGGSSGRLRHSFAIPAVGDLRNCLVAMSGNGSVNGSVLVDLFQHRFSAGNGLEGHSLGNLIVTALYQMSGSLKQAIEIAGRLLPLQGRALPVTETQTTLCAAFRDRTIIRGESQITAARRQIDQVLKGRKRAPARQTGRPHAKRGESGAAAMWARII